MDRDRSMGRAWSFLFSLALVVLLAAASVAIAAPRTGLDYITDADCDTEACTSASAPGCREGNILYLCNAGTGLYMPVASATPPGGANLQCQFNNNGVFGGDAGCTYNPATDTLSVEGLNIGIAGSYSPSAIVTFDTLTLGGDLTLSTGQKVALEGSVGDTYLIRDSAVRVIDIYKDGTLAATVRADSFGPPACPSGFGLMAPGICIQSSTGLMVFKDASGAFYRDGTVAQ